MKPLIREFASHRGHPHQRVGEDLEFVADRYLPYLEAEILPQVTPKLADYGCVKAALAGLAAPANTLPAEIATKAKELYEKFEAIDWDATRRPAAARPVIELSDSHGPPSDHPIWGINGMMHGVMMSHGPGGNPTYHLDRRYTPRNPYVIGHNGLQVGQWFPRQACAVFHGAHAEMIRGISGDPDHGAYSIVVSGAYDDIDRDEGNVIYYSSEGGHRKDARAKLDSTRNRALNTSYITGRPVRVLRSAQPKSAQAPECGIRYDGLYRVVSVESKWNEHGARFQLFKLVRQSDQRSLEDIQRGGLTAQQVHDYERIHLGY